jgi:hypothetical protein
MENAVVQLAKADIGIKSKKADDADKKDSAYSSLKDYEDRETGSCFRNNTGFHLESNNG